MSVPGGAGALCSTVVDLVRWTHGLMNFEVIGDEPLEAMTRPQAAMGNRPASYGYGLVLDEVDGTPRIQHGGGIHGFTAFLSHYPEQDLTIALLANCRGAPLQPVEAKVRRLFLAESENR